MSIDTRSMINISQIEASCLEYGDELAELADRAREFLINQPWCISIVEGRLDRGWGYMLAVFYFVIEPSGANIPNEMWIIVGDLPPAYIDVQDNPNGACAIDAYVMEMQKWVDCVIFKLQLNDVISVNAPATYEYAIMLRDRLDIIRNDILVHMDKELSDIRT